MTRQGRLLKMETFECLFDASSRQAFNTSKTYFCVLLFEKPGRNTLKDKKVSGYAFLLQKLKEQYES